MLVSQADHSAEAATCVLDLERSRCDTTTIALRSFGCSSKNLNHLPLALFGGESDLRSSEPCVVFASFSSFGLHRVFAWSIYAESALLASGPSSLNSSQVRANIANATTDTH